MIDQRPRPALGRQPGDINIVFENHRHTVKWAPHVAAGALGIECSRFGDWRVG